LQFVTISQPINAIAFVIDGLYYGVSDFAYAAYSMVCIFSLFCSLEANTFRNLLVIWYIVAQFFAGAVSSAFLVIATPKFGLPGVWAGLVLFMSLRAAAGFWR
jgi:Na+-driven multidrug efflux pump